MSAIATITTTTDTTSTNSTSTNSTSTNSTSTHTTSTNNVPATRTFTTESGWRDEVASLGRIVAVWAHPDDETYLAGGILAIAADLGANPVVVTATAGERGFDDETVWPFRRAVRTRQWEARAAMAILGVTDHRWLGYPDGDCANVNTADAAVRLAAILTEVQADTVLTFGADGMTGHPDHIAVSAWCDAAIDIVAADGGGAPRLLHAVSETGHHQRFAHLDAQLGVNMGDSAPPVWSTHDLAVFVQLPPALLDRKVAALRAMATQTSDIVRLLDLPTYAAWVSSEAFVDAPSQHHGVSAPAAAPTTRRAAAQAGTPRWPFGRVTHGATRPPVGRHTLLAHRELR
jgi:LmbE family N-acetylglucosaminyl deacetylase